MAAEDDSTAPASPKSPSGHGRRAKPPITLDLEANRAEETGSATEQAEPTGTQAAPEPNGGHQADPDTEPDQTPLPDSSGKKSGSLAASVLAGAIAGAAVVALGFALQMAGIIPLPGLDRLAASDAALQQRLSAVEAAQTRVDDLSARVEALAANIETLNERLPAGDATANASPDGSIQQAIDDLSRRLAQLEAASSEGNQAATAAVTDRISGRLDQLESEFAELQQRLNTLAAGRAEAAQSARAARTVVIESLHQAAMRGGPFADELADVKSLGISGEAVSSLEPLAEVGVPSRQQLATEFPAVADAMLAASQSARDGDGIVDQVLSFGRQFVTVRPTQPMEGNTPAAIVSRMQADVAAGDFDAALRERQALPPPAQAASETWASNAAARIRIDQLIDNLANASEANRSETPAAQ